MIKIHNSSYTHTSFRSHLSGWDAPHSTREPREWISPIYYSSANFSIPMMPWKRYFYLHLRIWTYNFLSPFGGNSVFFLLSLLLHQLEGWSRRDYTIFRFHQISFRLNTKLCHRNREMRDESRKGKKKVGREIFRLGEASLHHVPFTQSFYKFSSPSSFSSADLLRHKKHLAMFLKPFI